MPINPALISTIPVNNAVRIALPITSTSGTHDLGITYALGFDIGISEGTGTIGIYDSDGLIGIVAQFD